MSRIDRRQFLRQSAAVGGTLLAPSLMGLIACTDGPRGRNSAPPVSRALKGQGGYGELIPSKDVGEIISLPKGFHAAILSTAGQEMIGGVVPHAFDGMAAFAAGSGLVRLVRNHELRDTPARGAAPFGSDPYDDKGPRPSRCGSTPTAEPS